MPNYNDYLKILNDLNLNADGSHGVSGASVYKDEDDIYNITYTIFTSLSGVQAAAYYNGYTNPPLYDNILDTIATSTRVAAIDTAFAKIMTRDYGEYSVLFQDVANISFSEATSGAGIITMGQLTGNFAEFYDDPNNPDDNDDSTTSASTFAVDTYGPNVYGDIWINTEQETSGPNSFNTWEIDSTFDPGTRGFKVLLEEISHALGIDSIGNDLQGTALDNLKYTITSYNVHPDMKFYAPYWTGEGDAHGPYPMGLQLLDIAALQEIYGRNTTTRASNTVYSKDTAFASEMIDDSFVYTIWDGGGIDLIDAEGYHFFGNDAKAQIDLRQGHFSSIGYNGGRTVSEGLFSNVSFDVLDNDKGNLGIAYYAVVENASGADDDDELIGNAWNNVLYGGDGHDKLHGDGLSYDGDVGFHGNDPKAGERDEENPWVPAATDDSGNDVLIGGEGSDILFGGRGNDILHGGYNKAEIDSHFQNGSSDWDGAGQFTGMNNANEQAIVDIDYEGDGNDTVDYSKVYGLALDFENASVGHIIVTKTDTQTQQQWTDHLYSIDTLIGTAGEDVFFGLSTPSGQSRTLFDGGDGSDDYIKDIGSETGGLRLGDSGGVGIDTLFLNNTYGMIMSASPYGATMLFAGVYFDENDNPHVTETSGVTFSGIENIEIDGITLRWGAILNAYDQVLATQGSSYVLGYVSITDVVNYAYYGGTSGTGGGSVGAETDGSGNVTGMQVAPSIGHYVNYAYADEVLHPWVVTSYAASGVGDSEIHYESFIKDIKLVDGIRPEDVRLTAVYSGVLGAFELQIHIDSLNEVWNIPYAEAGKTINGIAVTDSSMYNWMTGAATGLSGGTGSYHGNYDDEYTFSTSSVTAHYDFETLTFADNTVWDMTAGLTFTGTESSEGLFGFDTRADVLYGLGGYDQLFSYGGDDTLVGGTGMDHMVGGDGNDTYIFAPGFGVYENGYYNEDTVQEEIDEGADIVRITGGLTAEDVYTWTDASGYFFLALKSDDADRLKFYATADSNTGTDVGQRVEKIVFDDASEIDLTQGLLLHDNDENHHIRSSSGNDVVDAAGGNDTVYTYGGTDTLTGGAGVDYLYGGTGNDTYIFTPGFGEYQNGYANEDQVFESIAEGTDTIHMGSSYTPDNVYVWTDQYGWLYIQSASDSADTLKVQANRDASGSDVANRIEYITFSDSTVWNLTEGLVLNDSADGHRLHGSAGHDVMDAGGGNDDVYGYAGNDLLTGGAGSDYLVGGLGDDTYIFEAGFGVYQSGYANEDQVVESLAEGTDTIHMGGSYTPDNVYTWTDQYGWLYIQSASDPADTLKVQANRDASGTDVADRIEYITFSDSTVWDLTEGLVLNDSADGHRIHGSANSDVIDAAGGNDDVYGYAGNDLLTGGAGSDYLYGGTGDDTYVFETGFGVYQSGYANEDQVFEALAEGTDTIQLGGSFTPDNVYTWTDSYGWLFMQSASDPADTLKVEASLGASGTDVGDRVEYVTFSDSSVWDLTEGLILNDNNQGHNMRGSAGADIVDGGGGNDTVYTYGGDDILIGGAGADYLSGGSGADTFVFEAATAFDASDTIADFSVLDGDVIDLRDLLDGGYDPLTDALADFVQSTESSGSTLLSVDYDGLGTAYGWTQIAMLSGTTGLGSADDMLTAGQLLVA